MGLSQQIGASSLIKPGVIDNSTQRPASPYEGQVIFQKDTDQMLVWNGTAWVIPNQTTTNPEGFELITTQSFSAQTQVDFVNVFTNNYANYRIVFEEMTHTANGEFLWRLRDSGGVISTSNYLTQRLEQVGAAVTPVASGVVSQFFPTFIIGSGTTAAAVSGFVDIFQPQVASKYTRFSGQFTRSDSTTSIYSLTCTGLFSLTTVCTGFSLIRHSTSTMSGTIRVYGYRNS